MKKSLELLLTSIALFLFAGCSKIPEEVEDYYPQVMTVSAIPLDNGDVLVTGRIIDPGEAQIEYVGFCMSDEGQPFMASNQLVATLDGNEFSAIYSGLTHGETYSFAAWATNDWGWTVATAIENVEAVVIPVDPPCNYSNLVYYNFSTQYFSSVLPINSSHTIRGNLNFSELYVDFSEPPTTGMYDIQISANEPNEVAIWVSNFDVFFFVSGEVYVNAFPNGSVEVTVCDGQMDVSGSLSDVHLNIVSEP